MRTATTYRLYDEKGMRLLDGRALQLPGFGEGLLMESAGFALWEGLRLHFASFSRLGVLCGPGNNGGDGWVLARLAADSGWDVVVHAPPVNDRTPSDAERARRRWVEDGGNIHDFASFDPLKADIWVDALFGLGMHQAPREPYASVIQRLNESRQPVLAVDIPSGVDVNTGSAPGSVVRASLTITMIADKLGLRTGSAVDYTGKVEVASLGLPESLHEGIAPIAERIDLEEVASGLPPLRPGAHKGDFGHVLVIGGAPGYSGAARLSATAALRAGAGRVTLLTHPEHASWANSGCPEVMVRAIHRPEEILPFLGNVNAIVVGPGLGLDSWGKGLWEVVANCGLPLVVDADALTLLAQHPRYSENWILTPHPGEAGRLLGWDTPSVNFRRVPAIQALQKRFGGVILLKGAGTLVCAADKVQGNSLSIYCLNKGHPGMAIAGMGDVLAGVIGALVGQKLSLRQAACLGGTWHILAALLALYRRGTERGILAGEVAEHLPTAKRLGPDEVQAVKAFCQGIGKWNHQAAGSEQQ